MGGYPGIDREFEKIDILEPQPPPTANAILYVAGGTGPFSEDVRIVVQSLRSGKRKVLIHGGTFPRYVLASIDGGEEPRWSGDGRQFFYRRGDKMMAVDVQSKPAFKAGSPRLLFEGPYAVSGRTGSFLTNYDVAPDGRHFLMLKQEDETQAHQVLSVVLNWTEELKRRTHTGTN